MFNTKHVHDIDTLGKYPITIKNPKTMGLTRDIFQSVDCFANEREFLKLLRQVFTIVVNPLRIVYAIL